MDTFPLTQLPVEILINIFKLINYNELCKAKLVCKLFHSTITRITAKSTRINFIDDQDYRKFVKKHSHSNFKLHSPEILEFASFARRSGNQVTDLNMVRFFNINLELVDAGLFKEILLRCPNLKTLIVTAQFHIPNDKVFEEPLPQLNLELLNYSLYSEPFKIFKNCTTKKLSLSFSHNHAEKSQPFKDFIKSQRHLESLEFYFFNGNMNLFADDQLKNVNFKLKSFVLSGHFPQEDLKNLKMFLRHHTESLEYLRIGYCHYAVELFDCFPNLKKLMLYIKILPESKPILSVENLCINFFYPFHKLLPNVKNMRGATFPRDLTVMDKLESLRIWWRDAEDYKFPENLKKIKFENTTSFPAKFPIGIKSITLKDCKEVDWLEKFLNDPMTQLDTLDVTKTSILKSSFDAINKHSSKIRNLILSNIEVLDDFEHDLIIEDEDMYQNMEIPEVRRIKFSFVDFRDYDEKFSFENYGRRIELLTFENCSHLDFLEDFFVNISWLKHLRIIGCEYLDKSILQVLEDNRAKIKRLDIVNCPRYQGLDDENDSDLDDKTK
jgi:hypothetical protein